MCVLYSLVHKATVIIMPTLPGFEMRISKNSFHIHRDPDRQNLQI